MKIIINNCHECPYYYQIEHEDLLDENICNHPNGFVFNNDSETPNSTPFRCPLREDPELIVEIKDDVIDPRITCALSMLYDDKKLCEDWLNRQHPEFDGLTPMELINKKQSDIVAEYLEDILLGHPH